MADPAREIADLRARRDALKAQAAEKVSRLKAAERKRRLAINRRIRRAESRLRTRRRREDTRRKILAGAWVLSEAARSEAAAAKLRRGLDAFLDKDRDRPLFELGPREAGGA